MNTSRKFKLCSSFFTFNIKFSISVFQTLIITFARLVELNSVYFILRFNIVEKRLFWGDEFKDNIISACRTTYTDTKWKKYFGVCFIFYYCTPQKNLNKYCLKRIYFYYICLFFSECQLASPEAQWDKLPHLHNLVTARWR